MDPARPLRDPGRRPRVLIYAPHLLPLSQPWIRHHAEWLPRFETALAGRRRVPDGLALGDTPSFCIEDRATGAFEGPLLILLGRSPGLEAFARRFQPDLIHAHFGPGGTEVLDLARRLRVPLVVSFHGWDAHLPADPARATLYERRHLARRARLFAEASLVLAPSHALHARLLALGADPARTETAYLGIDRDLFDGARYDDGVPRIAMVGRLVPSKGTRFALEALALLAARLPAATLEIIGDGPERPMLEQAAAARGLPVRFHGARAQPEARDLFARARVLLFPSTVTGGAPPETLGLAAAEAQAMGVPVVAARTGGIPEVVADGVTGFLVPDADPPALAAALERLLTDPGLHRRMSLAARRHAAARFDLRTNLARLADRYDALLAGRPHRAAAKGKGPGLPGPSTS
jgi:glycosyltransferase involved in cell wall biosynthesis